MLSQYEALFVDDELIASLPTDQDHLDLVLGNSIENPQRPHSQLEVCVLPMVPKTTPGPSLWRDGFGPGAIVDPAHVHNLPAREPGEPWLPAEFGAVGRIGKSKDARQ